ncbi:Transcriptional regulator, contains XRE-family HTH domain [Fibrobacter sp. UWB12]|nr:Transcriptional regulator, contains XRE-family HTH domain [Fibrobacter sp. UWB12]
MYTFVNVFLVILTTIACTIFFKVFINLVSMYYETLLLHEAIRLLLISIRQSRQHTQQSLSIESGISRQFISQMECGKRVPSLDTLSQLSIALKTNISSLMAELDRIYQHLVWQQNPKNAENALSDMQNAAESVYPSLEYIRNAKGFHQP